MHSKFTITIVHLQRCIQHSKANSWQIKTNSPNDHPSNHQTNTLNPPLNQLPLRLTVIIDIDNKMSVVRATVHWNVCFCEPCFWSLEIARAKEQQNSLFRFIFFFIFLPQPQLQFESLTLRNKCNKKEKKRANQKCVADVVAFSLL